jgi:CheY-like chemotaxis protein
VLILGNDPATTEMMAGLTGCSVVSARSVDEGLAALAASPYDLVILETSVVGADASDACARIRQREDPAPPILLLADAAQGRAVTMGAVAGADDSPKSRWMRHAPLRMRTLLRLKSLQDRLRTQAPPTARAHAGAPRRIGRNWSLTGRAEEFTRTVTRSVADRLGAHLDDRGLRATETIAASLPAHGLPDEVAGRFAWTWPSRAARRFDLGQRLLEQRRRVGPSPASGHRGRGRHRVADRGALDLRGQMLGLLVAANKPGGFTEADAEVAAHLARPAATFLQSRRILENQRSHAVRLDKLSTLVRDMAAILGRTPLLYLTVPRIQVDMGYERVAFYEPTAAGGLALAFESGAERPPQAPLPAELMEAALAGTSPVQVIHRDGVLELAVAVRAAEQAVGVLDVLKSPGSPFPEEEVSLLSTLAGQLALALQRSAIVLRPSGWPEDGDALPGVGDGVAQDLRQLFHKFSEEPAASSGRPRPCSGSTMPTKRTLVVRGVDREPAGGRMPTPSSVSGRIAGRVARDWVPIMLEEARPAPGVRAQGTPCGTLCVPLTTTTRSRAVRSCSAC